MRRGRGVSGEEVCARGVWGYLSCNYCLVCLPGPGHLHQTILMTWRASQYLAYDGQFWELVTWCSVSTRAQKLIRARGLSFSNDEQCSAAEGMGLLQSGAPNCNSSPGACHRHARHPSLHGCLWHHQIHRIK